MLTIILLRSLFGGYSKDQFTPRRAGRALLALRRPRLDHPVHGRLPDLTPESRREERARWTRPGRRRRSPSAEAEHTSHVRPTCAIFLALLVLTVARVLLRQGLRRLRLRACSIGGLMVLAVVKASLVGLFFMHLMFEGRWKYFMLVPTAFLACVAVFALVPDIAIGREEPSDAMQRELVEPSLRTVDRGPTPSRCGPTPRSDRGAADRAARSDPPPESPPGSPPASASPVTRSYRLGIAIVLGTVAAAAVLCFAAVAPAPRDPGRLRPRRGLAGRSAPSASPSGRAETSPRTTWPIGSGSPPSSSAGARRPARSSPPR